MYETAKQIFDVATSRRINKFFVNGGVLQKSEMRWLIPDHINAKDFFADIGAIRSDQLRKPVTAAPLPCPSWHKFLDSLEIDVEPLRSAMLQSLTRSRTCNLITGPSRSGKGVITHTLQALTGGNFSVASHLHDLTRSDEKYRRYHADGQLICVNALSRFHVARQAKVVQRIQDGGFDRPLWIQSDYSVDWCNCIELHKSSPGDDVTIEPRLLAELPGIRHWIDTNDR